MPKPEERDDLPNLPEVMVKEGKSVILKVLKMMKMGGG